MKNNPFNHRAMLAVGAICGSLLAGRSDAAVVTSNNLTSTNLGSLTNATTTQVSTGPFTVPAGQLIGVSADVTLLQTGIGISSYRVDALSGVAIANTTQIYVGTTRLLVPAPASYSQHHQLKMISAPSTTDLYYNLGVGRDDFGIANYRWQSDNITLHVPTGDDAGLLGAGFKGNLVPNASLEDSRFNPFFVGTNIINTAGTIVADATAPHGDYSLLHTGTADAHIAVPVEAGKTYAYSIWIKSTNAQLEWGFSVPADGYAITPGNLTSGGSASWIEMAGMFTVPTASSLWYFGGMTNGGTIYFDSIVVQQIPEPASLALLGLLVMSLPRAGLARRRR